jgi:signal transduction histidine kinase
MCSIIRLILTHYCAGDKIEKNEMGGACSTIGGEKRIVQVFGGEIWEKETTGETQA